jgi:hypothetical protein
MHATTLSPIAVTVKADDYTVPLTPLADGKRVIGIIGEGKPLGVEVHWGSIYVGISFDTTDAGTPFVDIEGEEPITLCYWRQRRAQVAQRLPNVVQKNVIEQLIVIARNWQPHLFQ